AGSAVASRDNIRYSVVDDRYFATMGIALHAGRTFDSRDRDKSTAVAIINATMAKRYWPEGGAVGRSLAVGDHQRGVIVIGVVADGKYEDVAEPPGPFMYYPLAQQYLSDIVVIARTT